MSNALFEVFESRCRQGTEKRGVEKTRSGKYVTCAELDAVAGLLSGRCSNNELSHIVSINQGSIYSLWKYGIESITCIAVDLVRIGM